MVDARNTGGGSSPDSAKILAPLLAALSSPRALRKAIAENSLAVMIGALAVTNVLRIVNNLILTRLLAPEAFGVIGVVTAITVILAMLTDMGFGAFVVRAERGDDSHFLSAIWTMRLIRSIILTVLMLTFAGVLAAAFDKPELTAPIRACSFLFLLEGLRSLAPISAVRHRRVSFISVLEFGISLIQMATALAAAAFIRSYWAIVIGMYAGAVANFALSYVLFRGYRHRLLFDREIGRELWAFSRFIIVSSVITVILGQADKAFIGRTLSLDALGLYMLAVSLTAAGQQLVLTYVSRVLFPIYAEAARISRAALADLYYNVRRRMTLTLSFLLGGGIGGGHLIARILFDERYLGAGIFISLLCFGPLFHFTTRPAEQALISLGKTRATVEANVARLAWIVIAAPAGLHFFGIIGLVAAFALIEAAAAPYWWARLAHEGIFKWRDEAAPLAVAALGAVLGFAANELVEYLIASGAVPYF